MSSQNNWAIQAEGLSKLYKIGGHVERFPTLRDQLTDIFKAPFRRVRQIFRGESAQVLEEDLWALKEISFEVPQGQTLGIIGKNGSGKSTLLKILSRITSPTEGVVRLRGRVGSLLEVGTGFHPELTGLENIYLNGAILGMRREELNRKLEPIIEFAELSKFIDTPVKFYSSGMYMRLAFSVAAHLEPEILLVDEVLAVGDASFQKKCLGKMGDVASEGRTVLFVSHDMRAIQRICQQVLWLQEGQLIEQGESSAVIQRYLEWSMDEKNMAWKRKESVTPSQDAYFDWVAIENQDKKEAVLTQESPPRVRCQFTLSKNIRDLMLTVAVQGRNDETLFVTAPQDCLLSIPETSGEYEACVELPAILQPGRYGLTIGLWLQAGGILDVLRTLSFEVQPSKSHWTNRLPSSRLGDLAIQCDWTLHRHDENHAQL